MHRKDKQSNAESTLPESNDESRKLNFNPLILYINNTNIDTKIIITLNVKTQKNMNCHTI